MGPLLINSKVDAEGPATVKLRLRSGKAGKGIVQWRAEGQDTFPKDQTASFETAGNDWQEVAVPLKATGKIVHLRLFPPAGKQPVAFDWIEIGSEGADGKPQRWDFQ